MMESDKENLHSPSFNAYSSSSSFSCNISSSSHTLAQIATRVVQEFHHFYDDDDDLFPHQTHKQQQPQSTNYNQNEDDNQNDQKENEEFEFAIFAQPPLHSSPVPADQIFYNGLIRPLYPLFNTNLLYFDANHNHNHNHNDDYDPALVKAKSAPVIRLPLGKLFMEETERDTASFSSSEADEYLQGVPADTYCVWRPKAPVDEAPEKCKKSNSTGSSSKRWKFRDLIYRSNSDGKDTFVFLATKKEEAKHKKSSSIGIRKEAAIMKGKGVPDEEAVKGSGRRRYLGEKKDTGPGLFANVSRSIHPF